jgi:hypothetical protein
MEIGAVVPSWDSSWMPSNRNISLVIELKTVLCLNLSVIVDVGLSAAREARARNQALPEKLKT